MIAAVLCGPTSIGKSRLALKLAKANGFEIISADSRQIYRGFSLGTNAPSEAELQIPHHLIGFLEPHQPCSPRDFPTFVHQILDSHPQKKFLIVGGTGLYIKELLYPSPFDRGATPEDIKAKVQEKIRTQGLPSLFAEMRKLDPQGTESLHPNDIYRITKRWENFLITGESYVNLTGPLILNPRFQNVPVISLQLDRDQLYARINDRVEEMMRQGWQREVENFLTIPGWENWPAFSSLGYREMADVIFGKINLKDAIEKIQKQTRNYAKRQLTFFRHQLPVAEQWQALELEMHLERLGWNWLGFK